MTKEREALKLALEALEYIHEGANNQGPHTGISWRCVSKKAEPAIAALREALAEQPAPPPECQTEAEKTAFAFGWWKALEQKRKADSALDRMAENARELGLDYEPPCKTGSQCTSKCPQCDEPALAEPKEKYRYGTPLLDAMTGKSEQPAQPCGYPYCGCNSKAWCKVEQQSGIKQVIELYDSPEQPAQQDYWQEEARRYAQNAEFWRGKYEAATAQQQERVMWGVDWGKAGDQSCVSIIKRLPGGGIEVLATEYGPPASKPWVGLTTDEMIQVKDRFKLSGVNIAVAFRTIEAKLREKNNG